MLEMFATDRLARASHEQDGGYQIGTGDLRRDIREKCLHQDVLLGRDKWRYRHAVHPPNHRDFLLVGMILVPPPRRKYAQSVR